MWARDRVHVQGVRAGLGDWMEGLVASVPLAVAPHDPLAAHHGVCHVLGAVARWKACFLADRAQAGVITEEGVDTFRVEDVTAWEFSDGSASLRGGRCIEIVQTDRASWLIQCGRSVRAHAGGRWLDVWRWRR